MSFLRFFLLIVLSVCLSISCDDRVVYKNSFLLTDNVIADTLSFNEIIKVGDIHKTDSFIVLRDVQENLVNFFYVYSFPELTYLYSFCPKGNGPNEYLMPTVVKNMPDNKFMIRDHSSDIIATYELTDSAAILVDSYDFPAQDGRYCWELNQIADSCFLLKRNNARISTRELWNLKARKLLDTIPNTFELAEEMGKDYHIEFDDCWISASDTTFAFAYFFINRIEYGRIVDNKIQLDGFVGVDETPDFYLYGESKLNNKYEYNVDNNIVYYEDLYVGPSRIYALYSGIPWGDAEIEHSSIIEIYDRAGTPIKQLNLNCPLSSFIVDEGSKSIYGINLEALDGAIIRYNYIID